SVYRVAAEGGAPELVAQDASYADDCDGRLVIAYRSTPGCPVCPHLTLREAGGDERDLVRFAAGEHLDYTLRCDRPGRQVLYGLSDITFASGPLPRTDLWLLSLDGGSPRRLTHDRAANVGTFTPDGRGIVFSSMRSGQAHLWEMRLDGAGAPR